MLWATSVYFLATHKKGEDRMVKAKTATFDMKCFGRDAGGNPALQKPVDISLKVQKYPDNDFDLCLSVDCPHNTGGHGQRCKASHPGVDKIGDGVLCPYSLDLPHALDKKTILYVNKVSE